MTGAAGFGPHPVRTAARRVSPDWIDYNGHMNVAYYTMAFDQALDEVYEALGIGATLARERRMGPMAVQTQITYLAELREGGRFACDVRLIDADARRVHVFLEMLDLDRGGAVAATYESLTVNVDLVARRAAPFPADAAARIGVMLAAQAGLPRPAQLGAPLGIRRRG